MARIKINTQILLTWLSKRWVERVGMALLACLVAVAWVFVFILLWPQTISYSYAHTQNCIFSPQVLPSLRSIDNSPTFRLSFQHVIKIGGLQLFAGTICAQTTSVPKSTTAYESRIRLVDKKSPLVKVIHVKTASYSKLTSQMPQTKPISLSHPLVLTLSQPDATFLYAVSVNNKISKPCTTKQTNVSCNLQSLRLNYGQSYDLAIIRLFHGAPAGTVLAQKFQTISATGITASSIDNNSTIQNSPNQLTLTTNKPIASLKAFTITTTNPDGSTGTLPFTSKYSGQTITVSFTSPLPRKTAIHIHLAGVTATDSSGLEVPYDLTFVTSGGPKVTGLNVASYDTLTSQSLQLSFDQPLNPAQDPNSYVTVLVNGNRQTTGLSVSDTKLTIAPPAGGYPLCATIVVQLSSAVQNSNGISGDSAGNHSTRTRCYTTFSIGTSVLGRAMTAYKFGNGSTMILYIAAMHGNESNTTTLLQKWIGDINANPGLVAANHTLVVIPEINPDGVAANTRLNAHGIDLNRNFPSNNWQTNVIEPGGAATAAGGPTPLSEPESQALANYIVANRPRLVLTYHSHAGIVEANDAGDSIALAAEYAAKSGYQAIPTYAIGNTFDYSTGGAMEDWMNDKLNLPAFVIELTTSNSDEFSKNQAAMRAMAGI